jgi:tetratricopeptide (TPR) repeat protein
MKPKPPLKRRRFNNEWDEIEYLYQKLLHWLYEREDAGKAAPFAERLERLLITADPNHESVLGEECWSLIYETRGEMNKAIEHRENEIRLMRRLHELAGASKNKSIALAGRGYDDLSDRLDLLATLYHDRGDVDKAISLLRESKCLCESRGIEFDGGDLLDEYLAENESSQEA